MEGGSERERQKVEEDNKRIVINLTGDCTQVQDHEEHLRLHGHLVLRFNPSSTCEAGI